MQEQQGFGATEAGTAAVPATYSPHAIHLVRTAVMANMQLSQMADQKASLLMGATFVVFTIAVGQARSGHFPIALSVLALFAFLSAMCAVFAVLPSVRGARRPELHDPAAQSDANILFFGVYTHLPEREFADKVLSGLHRDEDLFRMMLRDMYQNGQVLQRKKYRFLGIAYRIFLLGLTLTFITFVIEIASGRGGI